MQEITARIPRHVRGCTYALMHSFKIYCTGAPPGVRVHSCTYVLSHLSLCAYFYLDRLTKCCHRRNICESPGLVLKDTS